MGKTNLPLAFALQAWDVSVVLNEYSNIRNKLLFGFAMVRLERVGKPCQGKGIDRG
jgi:hypothetical protein